MHALVGIDHLHDVLRKSFRAHHMAGEDLDQHILVLWLEQILDCTGWQCGKGLVGGGEDREGAFAL